MTTTNEILVTLAVNGAWQPVYPHSDSRRKDGTTAQFSAFVCRFAVRSTVGYNDKLIGQTDHHGPWQDAGAARRFACSMGNVIAADATPELHGTTAQVVEVEPYWYCPAFGRLSAADLAGGELPVIA